MVTNVLLVGLRMNRNKNDYERDMLWFTLILVIAAVVVSIVFFVTLNENQENEKNPKKPMQKVVSTEIETHEIRCVEHTSNFCAKYKVFKIIKE